MSTQTANYHLTKPEDNDYYDIGVPNGNMDIIDTELKSRAVSLTTHEADAVAHTTQADHDKISGAVQSATIGGAAVTKSGTTLQFPAYPADASTLGGRHFNWNGQSGQPNWLWGGNDSDPTNMYVYSPSNFNVNHSSSATYSDHWVSSGGAALRNNTATVGGSPSGGSDGDGWDICT